MHKWAYFSMGIMAGVIVVLLSALLMQNHEPQAYAAPARMQGVDNTGTGLIMGVGGAQTQTNDILWVVHKRKAQPRAGASTNDVTSKDERITLCCYQIANGARFMKLVAARDISFDMDIVELNNDRPRVKDIVDQLKKQQRK